MTIDGLQADHVQLKANLKLIDEKVEGSKDEQLIKEVQESFKVGFSTSLFCFYLIFVNEALLPLS